MDERTDEAQDGSVTEGSPYRRALELTQTQTLVIIGNGMMSWKLCQKLVECGANQVLKIVVFGEEPRPAYDRVHLTELLSNKTAESLTLAPAEWYADNDIELYVGDPIVEIDRDECVVRSANGGVVEYDRLVFATGSRPFVPAIEGTDLPGVFVYRTIEHLEAIEEYRRDLHRAAVIGGGLLGLEAAKAVYDLGLEVYVVEFAPGLMPRQLDPPGAELLKDKLEQLGVRIYVSKQTTRIEDTSAQQAPDQRATAKGERGGVRTLHFSDGGKLEVDMVVISAGIRPRGDLAAAAGIEIAKNGGIIVDDHLTTSDPRIFAVGECAFHRGMTYGLAFPGFKMVEVLVDNLVGGTAEFKGADQSAKLKLMGVTVASMGDHNEKEVPNSIIHSFCANGFYRKLVVRDGKIVGAIAVGEWENLDRIREAIEHPRTFSFWDIRRFRSTGLLWQKSESPPITEWPEDALVCGCLRVNRGTLSQAQLDGCFTVEELCARTGAGTMCGSCKPLLAELLGGSRDSVPPSMRADAVVSSLRGAPMSVRSGPVSRRYSQVPASSGAASGPSSVRESSALPRRSSIVPSSRDIIARHTPTPVVPVMAPGDEAPAPESATSGSDAGPMSVRGSMLPSRPPRRTVRPSAPMVRVEAAAPLAREISGSERDMLGFSGGAGPPSTRSFRPPQRISYAPGGDDGDDEPAPISVRGPNLPGRPSKVPSLPPSTSKSVSIEFRAMDARAAKGSSTKPQSILPPAPSAQGDSMLPPPDSVSPGSLRDIVPPSMRDSVSLRLREPGRLMREAAFFPRDAEGEGRDALRGREGMRGQGTEGSTSEVPTPGTREGRDSDPVSSSNFDASPSSRRDSAPPPSRRRDSLPPLRPISVPPVRGSIAPGRISMAPPRSSMAPPRTQGSAERGYRVLLAASIIALAVAMVVATMGPLPVHNTARARHIDELWTTGNGKQATGYLVVGLGLLSLLLSVRKRVQRFTWSDVPILRVVHAILGVVTLLALICHTGLHLGMRRSLNLALMIDLLALTLLGAGAGGLTALSHHFSPLRARNVRSISARAHLILFWPLPVLLALHILDAYYY